MTPAGTRIEVLRWDLRRLDGSHAPVERLLGVLDASADAFSRYHYTPGHVTGSAFVIHPVAEAVALIHHEKLGLWVQPGGHVEPEDETVELGSRREVAEEVGLRDLAPLGVVDVDVHTFPAHGEQPTHLHFDVRYGFRARTHELIAGDGVHEARWVPADEVLAMDESVARAVRRIAALLGW